MTGLRGVMLTTATAAQVDSGLDVDVALGEGLASGAVGAFLTTLIVGAILIAVAPDYTERMMDAVVDDPIGSVVYGVVSLVVIFVLVILLVVTIVGILLAIPLLLLAYLLWAIGSAIAFLAIGDRLVSHGEGWLKPLLVGAGINGVLVVTGVGSLLAICIGAAGFGAVLRSWLD